MTTPSKTNTLTTPSKTKQQPKLTIWQWNCRSFKNKRGDFQQYVSTFSNPPDVISLQETTSIAKLPGYLTLTTQNGRDVCTLIKKDISAIQHQLTTCCHDNILVELIPRKTKKTKSTFVLNV